MDELKIVAAVIECVSHARRATSYPRAVEEFVAQLQYWREWPPEEAEEVARRVARCRQRFPSDSKVE